MNFTVRIWSPRHKVAKTVKKSYSILPPVGSKLNLDGKIYRVFDIEFDDSGKIWNASYLKTKCHSKEGQSQ